MELASAKQHLEHVMQWSLVLDGLGSGVGLLSRVVGKHALGTVI